jgi:rhodanese-related sulfurtransferase
MIPLRSWRDAALIGLCGLFIGLAVNHRLVFDAFSGRGAEPLGQDAALLGGYPQPVQLAELRDLLAAGALPVDAREADRFAAGHLPGAVSLPLAAAGDRLTAFRSQVPVERTLVIYCSGYGCQDSFDLGLRLIEAGYRDVRIFEGGFPAWNDAGLPVVKGER